MAGVGEALAIVGVVAGLIQAIDAGQNIVNRIKQRRLAHRANGALPPSDQLEQTLADGKRDIQQLVEKGTRRFGNDFVADETARMAIMEVTIQIQNALLLRLTEARADDGVIDFDECIDLSDKACNDALVALQELYKRKLNEDLAQKKRQKEAALAAESTPNLVITPIRSFQDVQPLQHQQITPPSSRGSDSRSRSPNLAQIPTEDIPPTPPKKSRTFGVFRSNKNKSTDATKLSPTVERYNTAPSNLPVQRQTAVPRKPVMTNTQPARRPSLSQPTPQIPLRPKSQQESEDTWRAEMSRASTVRTTRAPTLSSINTTTSSTLSKYNGSCKYAYKFRETGLKGSLDPINPFHHKQDWQHRCRSNKCQFRIGAADNGRTQGFDNKVYKFRGVSYRKSLLAKSHVAYDKECDEFPYICLVCVFLGRDSQIYNSTDNLFEHISQHEESDIGPDNISVIGPLVFGATGIKAPDDFDLMIVPLKSPEPLSPTLEAELTAAVKQVVQPPQPEPSHTTGSTMMATYKSPVMEDDSHTNPYHDPWRDISGGIGIVHRYVPNSHR